MCVTLFLSCRWSRWIRGAASSERHHEDLEHQLHAELGLAAGRCRDPRRHLHHAICAVSLRITRAGLIYLSDGGHRGRGPPETCFFDSGSNRFELRETNCEPALKSVTMVTQSAAERETSPE